MEKRSVRVVLASEYPEVRHFLSRVIERERGVDVVGEAQDAGKALTLVKNLKPDVAVIDCSLPHVVGLQIIPLARISGLDIAQAISEEVPNIRVILLNNLDTEVLSDRNLSPRAAAGFFIESMGTDTPFVMKDLYDKVVPSDALVFANVKVKPKVSRWWRVSGLDSKEVVFGGLSILGGFGLIWTLTVVTGATVLLAYPGAALLGIGIGLLIKRTRKRTK